MRIVRQTLQGHTKDLGCGMLVRRRLPAAAQRSAGPFVYFDHFGPVTVHPSDNHDVRAKQQDLAFSCCFKLQSGYATSPHTFTAR